MRAPCDEGVVRSLRTTSPCTRADEPWILAATILGSTMAFIDGTVVGIALPALQKDLATTLPNAEWTVEAYALFVGALILAGGALGDRFGRVRIFLSGVVIFEVASIASGLAPTVEWLIAFRALQGVGGALLIPGRGRYF